MKYLNDYKLTTTDGWGESSETYNSNDGGVSLFTSLDGTNWTMIGLSCSAYSFNKSAEDRLRKIIKGK